MPASTGLQTRLYRRRRVVAWVLLAVVLVAVVLVATMQARLKSQVLHNALELAQTEARNLDELLAQTLSPADATPQRLPGSVAAGQLQVAYAARLVPLVHSIELQNQQGRVLLATHGADTPSTQPPSGPWLPGSHQARTEALPDGHMVLTAYRASAYFPLVTVVRYSADQALTEWASTNWLTWGLTAAGVLVLLAVAVWLQWRQEGYLRRRWVAEQQTRLASTVFAHAREAISITDLAGNIVAVNRAFTRITGYAEAEVVGQNPRLLSSGRQSKAFYEHMWRELLETGHWEGEIWNRRKNGETFAEVISISVVPDEHGKPQNFLAIFQDITQQKEHTSQMDRLAHFDPLTELPNRVLLADRLRQALNQAQRRGTLAAVVFMDLDGFKAVNDQHGHQVGDELLVAVSQRLKAALRDGDTLARVGGDEFVAVLSDIAEMCECEGVLERLLAAAAEPAVVRGVAARLSVSLGVAVFPKDGTEADTLLRHADQAMYEAKQAGRNRYHLFDVDQDAFTRQRVTVRAAVAQGLQNQEFVLHYQPKVNMRLGTVVGAEALLRWQDPLRGLVAPGVFLPDIEGHALGNQLGDWVLATALRQLSEWTAAGAAVSLSINISAFHLQQPQFVGRLAELLASHPLVSPQQVELEVLETSALDDIARVSSTMGQCVDLGVSFALDDFGTGYSSLTYLKRLPASVLKIDQSFIRDMLVNGDDLAIVKGVIGLADAFHRQVIAEGVETQAHGRLLQSLGCDLIQGYGVARPMPAEALPAWVAAWEAEPVWTSP